MTSDIDFVLLWVDGNDPKWRQEMMKYKKQTDEDYAVSDIRFRDWDNLQYWFRAVEKFAPWVRKIHFITCGQKPTWLNENHPKLNLVHHQDYIPEEYLPTFSSHVIENNLHRLNNLSEKFVLFNDDLFITKPIEPSFFFKNDLPLDFFVQNAISGNNLYDKHTHHAINNIQLINIYFNKIQVIKNNFFKVFNYKYGLGNLRNICLLPWPKFTGFLDSHLAQPFLKSTFERVWTLEHDYFNEISKNKFRDNNDLSQYAMRYWQLCSGKFKPCNIKKRGQAFTVKDKIILKEVAGAIKKQKYNTICLNDDDLIDDFKKYKQVIQQSFNFILPKKSSFEV